MPNYSLFIKSSYNLMTFIVALIASLSRETLILVDNWQSLLTCQQILICCRIKIFFLCHLFISFLEIKKQTVKFSSKFSRTVSICKYLPLRKMLPLSIYSVSSKDFSVTKYSSSASSTLAFFLSHFLQWSLLQTIPYCRLKKL